MLSQYDDQTYLCYMLFAMRRPYTTSIELIADEMPLNSVGWVCFSIRNRHHFVVGRWKFLLHAMSTDRVSLVGSKHKIAQMRVHIKLSKTAEDNQRRPNTYESHTTFRRRGALIRTRIVWNTQQCQLLKSNASDKGMVGSSKYCVLSTANGLLGYHQLCDQQGGKQWREGKKIDPVIECDVEKEGKREKAKIAVANNNNPRQWCWPSPKAQANENACWLKSNDAHRELAFWLLPDAVTAAVDPRCHQIAVHNTHIKHECALHNTHSVSLPFTLSFDECHGKVRHKRIDCKDCAGVNMLCRWILSLNSFTQT